MKAFFKQKMNLNNKMVQITMIINNQIQKNKNNSKKFK